MVRVWFRKFSQMNMNINDKPGISHPSQAKQQPQPRPVPLINNDNNNARAGNMMNDDIHEIVRYHQTMIRCIANKDKEIVLDMNMIDSELFAKVIHSRRSKSVIYSQRYCFRALFLHC